MIKFKKEYVLKMASIITVISFIMTSVICPDISSFKRPLNSLRKQMDFNGKDIAVKRYQKILKIVKTLEDVGRYPGRFAKTVYAEMPRVRSLIKNLFVKILTSKEFRIIIIITGFDQIFKALIRFFIPVSNIAIGNSGGILVTDDLKIVWILEDIIGITHGEHFNSAAGPFASWMIALVCMGILKKYSSENISKSIDLMLIGLNFVLAGGLGNVLDLLFFKSATNWIYLKYFDIYFNIADVCLSFAIPIIIIGAIIISVKNKKIPAVSEKEKAEKYKESRSLMKEKIKKYKKFRSFRKEKFENKGFPVFELKVSM